MSNKTLAVTDRIHERSCTAEEIRHRRALENLGGPPRLEQVLHDASGRTVANDTSEALEGPCDQPLDEGTIVD